MTLVADRGGEILCRLPRSGSLQGVEVGVYDGRLSRYLLAEEPRLTLLMVDRWAEVPETHSYAKSESQMAKLSTEDWHAIRCLARDAVAKNAGRAVILRGESIEIARFVEPYTLDFAFIDAEHSYDAVKDDILAWWTKVKPGGWLCGHDWQHPETHTEGSEKRWGVEEAVNEFFDADRIEVGRNRTWFVKC
jgi:hypothetical protein